MRWTNPRPTPGFCRRFAERVVETHVAKGQLRGELPVGESLARAYGSIETSVSRVSGGPFEFSILFGTSMVAGTGTDSHTRTQQAWLRSVRAPAGIMENEDMVSCQGSIQNLIRLPCPMLLPRRNLVQPTKPSVSPSHCIPSGAPYSPEESWCWMRWSPLGCSGCKMGAAWVPNPRAFRRPLDKGIPNLWQLVLSTATLIAYQEEWNGGN